jgi:hypothetical protein
MKALIKGRASAGFTGSVVDWTDWGGGAVGFEYWVVRQVLAIDDQFLLFTHFLNNSPL